MKRPNERINRFIRKIIREELDDAETTEDKSVDLSNEIKELKSMSKSLSSISLKISEKGFSGFGKGLIDINITLSKLIKSIEGQV